jgi:hypothetical protein
MLSDVLKLLKEKENVVVSIDEAAFARIGVKNVSDSLVTIRRIERQAPVSLVVEMIAQEVGGWARKEKDRYVISPGTRSLQSALLPANEVVAEKLRSRLTLERVDPINTLQDVVEFFEERNDVLIVIDKRAFESGGMRRVEDRKCSLPAGTNTVESWLTQLAAQVGGIVVPRENILLIVPKPKDDAVER